MLKIFAVFILTAGLSGCITEQATLTNVAGEQRFCYSQSSIGFSRIGAAREFNRCLNDAGAAGFKRVD